MSYGNVVVRLIFKLQLLQIVVVSDWGKSRENNRGGRLGCLKCSYGPDFNMVKTTDFVY